MLAYAEDHVTHVLRPASGRVGRPLRIGHAWSFTFDAAWQPLAALLDGHAVHIVGDESQRDAEALVHTIGRFGIDLLALTKAQRLRVGESAMTHAMVLTAVHLGDDGRCVRWRVQNSWGPDRGDQGWFVMSDEWMDEFVYQAVVDPRFLARRVRDVLGKEPVVLPLWDPMGRLA